MANMWREIIKATLENMVQLNPLPIIFILYTMGVWGVKFWKHRNACSFVLGSQGTLWVASFYMAQSDVLARINSGDASFFIAWEMACIFYVLFMLFIVRVVKE